MTTSASIGCSLASCAPKRVGAREVDVFENAARLARRSEFVHEPDARQGIAAFDDDDFTGAHFPNRRGLDQIECACFG